MIFRLPVPSNCASTALPIRGGVSNSLTASAPASTSSTLPPRRRAGPSGPGDGVQPFPVAAARFDADELAEASRSARAFPSARASRPARRRRGSSGSEKARPRRNDALAVQRTDAMRIGGASLPVPGPSTAQRPGTAPRRGAVPAYGVSSWKTAPWRGARPGAPAPPRADPRRRRRTRRCCRAWSVAITLRRTQGRTTRSVAAALLDEDVAQGERPTGEMPAAGSTEKTRTSLTNPFHQARRERLGPVAERDGESPGLPGSGRYQLNACGPTAPRCTPGGTDSAWAVAGRFRQVGQSNTESWTERLLQSGRPAESSGSSLPMASRWFWPIGSR